MSPREGVFRRLRHEISDEHWWIVLRGMWTDQAGLTGRRVLFAQCGSACWPNRVPPSTLRWCEVCFPGVQTRLDEQQRQRQQQSESP